MNLVSFLLCILTSVSANTTSASSISDLSELPVECNASQYGKYLKAMDCSQALEKLPRDQAGDVHLDPQTRELIYPVFRRNSPEARHRLPQREQYGMCVVEVGLVVGSTAERSLWAAIRERADAIISECVEDELGMGGFAITGDSGRIEVVLLSAMHASSVPLINSTLAWSNSTSEIGATS
ncbi:hypothetical protein MMC28_000430 [Mycoblastus sanguinarius]|nr:hypothetical protein [Mycoblastus sanguinarius]